MGLFKSTSVHTQSTNFSCNHIFTVIYYSHLNSTISKLPNIKFMLHTQYISLRKCLFRYKKNRFQLINHFKKSH